MIINTIVHYILVQIIDFIKFLFVQIYSMRKIKRQIIGRRRRAPTSIISRDPREMDMFVFRPFQLENIGATVADQIDADEMIVPYPRSGHRIVSNEKFIYCFGGYNPQNQGHYPTGLFKELWKFNRHTLEWIAITDTANMPKELASNAVLLEGEILMIFGGTGFPFGESCSNKLSVCYPNRTPVQFKRVKTRGKKPIPSYGQTMVFHDNHLYTIGGTTGFVYFCNVHKLDLRTLKWESVYETNDGYPRGRYRHGIAYDGNFIYVLGGGTATESFDLIELPSFDLNKNTWKYIKTLPDESAMVGSAGDQLQLRYPPARKCHSCIQYRDDDEVFVVVAGGNYNNEIHYDDIWRLSLKSYRWSLLRTTTLPRPLFFHDATTSGDGCMYIFGGIMVNGESSNRINDVYKIWLKIPKLSAICWEAVLHYYPNLKTFNHDKLLELGIPLKYVSALQT